MQSGALSASDFATSSTPGSSLTRRVVPYACGTPGHVDHIACFEVTLNGKQMPLDPTIDEQRVKHLTVDACTARADQIYVHLHRCCRTRKRVWAPESGGPPKPLTPEPDWKSQPTPEEKIEYYNRGISALENRVKELNIAFAATCGNDQRRFIIAAERYWRMNALCDQMAARLFAQARSSPELTSYWDQLKKTDGPCDTDILIKTVATAARTAGMPPSHTRRMYDYLILMALIRRSHCSEGDEIMENLGRDAYRIKLHSELWVPGYSMSLWTLRRIIDDVTQWRGSADLATFLDGVGVV